MALAKPCTNWHCGYSSHGGDGYYHPDQQQRYEARSWGAGIDPSIGFRPDWMTDPPMTREVYLRDYIDKAPPIDLCPYWRSPEPRRALIAVGWPVRDFPAHWTKEERENVLIPEN